MRTRCNLPLLALLASSLLLGACSKKTETYSADSTAATTPPAATSQQSPSPATVPTIPTDTAQHHSKLKGALVGGAIGAVMGGKRGAVVGAAAGAALQHERNKNEAKKAATKY